MRNTLVFCALCALLSSTTKITVAVCALHAFRMRNTLVICTLCVARLVVPGSSCLCTSEGGFMVKIISLMTFMDRQHSLTTLLVYMVSVMNILIDESYDLYELTHLHQGSLM